jgi:hypothetical protein
LVQGSFIPQVLAWSGSMQYSMPYLKSEIQDLQRPDFIYHLIPIVEFQMSTPNANNFGNSFLTTGTINPGVIWVGSYFQVGLEAQLPVNGASGHASAFSANCIFISTTSSRPPSGVRCLAGHRPLPASSPFKGMQMRILIATVSLLLLSLGASVAAVTPFSTMRVPQLARQSVQHRAWAVLWQTKFLHPSSQADRPPRPHVAGV